MNFTNLVLNGKTENISISSPTNLVINEPSNSSYINYTTAAGVQYLKLPNTPSQVKINNTETTSAWSYTNGLLLVTTTGNDNVQILTNAAVNDTTGGTIGGDNPSPTITPTPTPIHTFYPTTSPSLSPIPSLIEIIEKTTGTSITWVIVVALIIFLVIFALFVTSKNSNQKLKNKLKVKDYQKPY